MAGTRTTDSFSEGLHKLLQSVTDLKTTDDADLPFAINLETAILQRLKQGATAAMGGQPPGGAPAPTLPGAAATTPGPGMVPGGGPGGMPGPVPAMAGLPGPPGGPPGGPAGLISPTALPPGPAGPALPPAAVPGLMQGPNFPNPDELRRALATGTMASRLNNVAARLANVIPTSAQI